MKERRKSRVSIWCKKKEVQGGYLDDQKDINAKVLSKRGVEKGKKKKI